MNKKERKEIDYDCDTWDERGCGHWHATREEIRQHHEEEYMAGIL